MSAPLLRRVSPRDVKPSSLSVLDEATRASAAALVDEARTAAGLRAAAERLGDVLPGAPLLLDRAALAAAYAGLGLVCASNSHLRWRSALLGFLVCLASNC